MESTEKQVKTTASDSLIFKCAICGNDCCSRCEGRNQYWNGFLCNSCYNSFHIRSTTRIKKIKRKKEVRNRFAPFAFEINDVQMLKIGIDALSSLDDNGALKIYKTEIVFLNCDAPKICYSDVKILERDLNTIIVPKKAEIFFLNLTDLKNALESFSRNKKVLLQRKQGKEELLINPVGEKKTITIKSDVGEFEIPYPNELSNIEYHASFFIGKEKLIEILTNCKNFDTRFTLKCTKESVIFSAKGNTTSYEYEFLSEELENYTIKEESKNQYELEILLLFLERMSEIIDSIELSHNTGYPLKVDINDGQSEFYIAPRVNKPEEGDDYI